MTRSIEALKLLKLPVAPIVIRTRARYQTVVESGQSAEEAAGDVVSAREMRAFCDFVRRFVFGARSGRIMLKAEDGELV